LKSSNRKEAADKVVEKLARLVREKRINQAVTPKKAVSSAKKKKAKPIPTRRRKTKRAGATCLRPKLRRSEI
jgi:hypothetical protein